MTISVIAQPALKKPKEKRHYIWWHTATETVGFFVLAIIFLESYFRLAGVGCGEFLQPDLRLGTSHIPDKQVVWRAEGFSNNKINSAGLRDSEHKIAKEPGVYRIALLGDSFVEAFQVDLNDTFGKVLETRLNNTNSNRRYETINFGCGGYSTAQEFVQYKSQGIKYNPDAIVLLFNRGDSMESVVTTKARKKAEPKPYFYIDQSGQLKEDDLVLAANFDKIKPHPIWDWLRKYSTIYSVINQSDFSLTLNEPRYRKIKGWLTSLSNRVRRVANPVSKEDFSSSQASTDLYPDQDEMAVTKALISKLAQQAAQNGQLFIVVIYPNLDHYVALTEQAQQLKSLAKEKHFLYLDLSPSFLADPQPRSNFALYHLNKKGHLTVANQLFEIFKAK